MQHFDAVIVLAKPFSSHNLVLDLKGSKKESKFKNVLKQPVDYYPVEQFIVELKVTVYLNFRLN